MRLAEMDIKTKIIKQKLFHDDSFIKVVSLLPNSKLRDKCIAAIVMAIKRRLPASTPFQKRTESKYYESRCVRCWHI